MVPNKPPPIHSNYTLIILDQFGRPKAPINEGASLFSHWYDLLGITGFNGLIQKEIIATYGDYDDPNIDLVFQHVLCLNQFQKRN